MARTNAMATGAPVDRPDHDTRGEPPGSRRMPWSFRVGTIRGIPVDIHATFLLLLGWLAVAPLIGGESLATALRGVALIVAVFATVVLHELAHATVARRFGVGTRRILLLPIGGIASLEGMPKRPREELLVAIAGPLVNIAIALALALMLAIAETMGPAGVRVATSPFLTSFLWINVSIAALNLLPAFPMDGGRVLRALLTMRVGRDRATAVAASIGRGVAVIFAIVGLFVQPMLILIGLFVWLAARAEETMEHTRWVLRDVPVHRAMISRIDVLPPYATVKEAADLALGGFQQDFPVADASGRLVGLVTRSEMMRALAKGGLALPVSEVMQHDPAVALPNEMLETALERMEKLGTGLMVVTYDGAPVGLVTAESAAELVLRHDALSAMPPSFSPRSARADQPRTG
jgi:Zn-dependent protease